MVIWFYADLYWIINFIMNLFLLYVTAYMRQKQFRGIRWIVISAVFAIISFIITYISNYRLGKIYLPISLAEIILIVWLAYEHESLSIFFKDFAAFIASAVFTAGALLMFTGIMNTDFSMIFLLLSILMLFILFRFIRFSILKQNLNQKSMMRATVIHHGRKQQIKVLYDTGNHLVSPYSGEPVVIISRGLSESLDVEHGANPLLIPYHSIGGDGLLKAYRLEFLLLSDGSVRKNFLAAVSEDICTEKEIQMILNI